MEILNGLEMPLITAFCMILGFILKKWIHDEKDKFIPTILVLIGAILGCILNQKITIEGIVGGAFSALSSTGTHQLFKQLLSKKEDDK